MHHFFLVIVYSFNLFQLLLVSIQLVNRYSHYIFCKYTVVSKWPIPTFWTSRCSPGRMSFCPVATGPGHHWIPAELSVGSQAANPTSKRKSLCSPCLCFCSCWCDLSWQAWCCLSLCYFCVRFHIFQYDYLDSISDLYKS